MTVYLKEIISSIDAEIVGSFDRFSVENISIDSRSLQNNSGTLFFALKGNNHDAHNYIEALIKKGVVHFVVEYIPENVKGKAVFFVVSNTLDTLQIAAKKYRALFHFPIIGITGSNGKTIVKEWLNFLLSPDYSIVRSPRSFNSQVGVPLSIFGINENHNLGIFEAGISVYGEMQNLEEMISPTIGVFTHIGNVHDEGFESTEQKTIEKLKLFKNSEIVILQKNEAVEKHLSTKSFTWSFTDKKATVFAEIITSNPQLATIAVTYNNTTFNFSIKTYDSYSLTNALNCICVLLYLNLEIPTIQNRIENLYPVEIRLQAKKGINNCILIDDSFSSDYQSLKIALDFLEQQKLHQKKTIILSDIFQSGLPLDILYKKVTNVLIQNNIDRIIVIGETISSYLKEVPNVIAFNSTFEFLKQFNLQSFHNETILIKGARSFSFDEIVVVLEEKNHETVLEINLDDSSLSFFVLLFKSAKLIVRELFEFNKSRLFIS